MTRSPTPPPAREAREADAREALAARVRARLARVREAVIRLIALGAEDLWGKRDPTPPPPHGHTLVEGVTRSTMYFNLRTHRCTHVITSVRCPDPWADEQVMTFAEGLAQITAETEAIVAHTVATIWDRVQTLVPGDLRRAVLSHEELTTRWPWDDHHEASAVLLGLIECMTPLNYTQEAMWIDEPFPYQWPAAVAAAHDVAKWAEAHLKRDDRVALTVFRAQSERGEWGAIDVRWRALAVLYAAVQAVEQHQRTRVIRHSSTRAGRAALAVLSAGPGPTAIAHPWRPGMEIKDHAVELVWDGRRTPVQLRLALEDEHARFDYLTMRSILEELHTDGLRDWLILHRMAGEQGATGTLRWTWGDHKTGTPYAREVTRGKATDDDLAAATIKRLWQLKRAEIRLYGTGTLADGSTPWLRVGPWGLLDIPAGTKDPLGRDRMVVIKLNPAIYAGAKRHAPAANFLLLAESAVNLAGAALRLVTLLTCDWQYARAEGLIRDAATLWEYASIRAGRKTERKHWPAATRTLERLLTTLVTTDHLGDWRALDGEGATRQYQLRPPQWWIDQVIHEAPPVFEKSLATTPTTGRELKAWRTKHGWSKPELAKLAAVGLNTIKRAEDAPTKPLSPRLVARLRPL